LIQSHTSPPTHKPPFLPEGKDRSFEDTSYELLEGYGNKERLDKLGFMSMPPTVLHGIHRQHCQKCDVEQIDIRPIRIICFFCQWLRRLNTLFTADRLTPTRLHDTIQSYKNFVHSIIYLTFHTTPNVFNKKLTQASGLATANTSFLPSAGILVVQ
jgi:hypothetical protein